VLFAVEPAKHLRLVILDACRDNPFAKTMKRTIAARAVGRGLRRSNRPTEHDDRLRRKAGSTASDGDSKNSPNRLCAHTVSQTRSLDASARLIGPA